ncbi:MAG: M15 family metallopeptidase, partial [Minisyncoccia bacterium]
RGYQKRTYVQGQDLVEMDGLSIQKQVADSYVRLRDEMLEQDLSLFIASGYRSSTKQRSLFLEKVGDINTSEILSGIHHDRLEYALERSALPGYSKHHSGFAVDFACGKDYVVFGFGFTECYDWLSKNNFEQAKRFGFIPSYPDNIPNQGPNPEPWEFVWVGVENIK